MPEKAYIPCGAVHNGIHTFHLCDVLVEKGSPTVDIVMIQEDMHQLLEAAKAMPEKVSVFGMIQYNTILLLQP